MHSLDVYSEDRKRSLRMATRVSCLQCDRVAGWSLSLAYGANSNGRVYLDQDCVWAHLKTYDIGGRRPESERQGGFRLENTNQHLPIFVPC